MFYDDKDLKTVIRLKDKMEAKGYKQGWLFHQCKNNPRLLAALNSISSDSSTSLQHIDVKQPLLVDLVPSSVFYNNIRSLFTKEDWEVIKSKTFEKADNKCEICSCIGPKHPVECHEIWEYNLETQTQILKGTQALCPMCHSAKHIGLAGIKGKDQEAKKRIMKINGWSMTDLELYLEHCWEQWSRRSNISWNLDIQIIVNEYPEFKNKYKSYYKNTERL